MKMNTKAAPVSQPQQAPQPNPQSVSQSNQPQPPNQSNQPQPHPPGTVTVQQVPQVQQVQIPQQLSNHNQPNPQNGQMISQAMASMAMMNPMVMQGVGNRSRTAVATLNAYIFDYLKKQKCEGAAKAFFQEANLTDDTTVAENHNGALLEWWTIFWDIYSSRQVTKQQLSLSTDGAFPGQWHMPQDAARIAAVAAAHQDKINMQYKNAVPPHMTQPNGQPINIGPGPLRVSNTSVGVGGGEMQYYGYGHPNEKIGGKMDDTREMMNNPGAELQRRPAGQLHSNSLDEAQMRNAFQQQQKMLAGGSIPPGSPQDVNVNLIGIIPGSPQRRNGGQFTNIPPGEKPPSPGRTAPLDVNRQRQPLLSPDGNYQRGDFMPNPQRNPMINTGEMIDHNKPKPEDNSVPSPHHMPPHHMPPQSLHPHMHPNANQPRPMMHLPFNANQMPVGAVPPGNMPPNQPMPTTLTQPVMPPQGQVHPGAPNMNMFYPNPQQMKGYPNYVQVPGVPPHQRWTPQSGYPMTAHPTNPQVMPMQRQPSHPTQTQLVQMAHNTQYYPISAQPKMVRPPLASKSNEKIGLEMENPNPGFYPNNLVGPNGQMQMTKKPDGGKMEEDYLAKQMYPHPNVYEQGPYMHTAPPAMQMQGQQPPPPQAQAQNSPQPMPNGAPTGKAARKRASRSNSSIGTDGEFSENQPNKKPAQRTIKDRSSSVSGPTTAPSMQTMTQAPAQLPMPQGIQVGHPGSGGGGSTSTLPQSIMDYTDEEITSLDFTQFLENDTHLFPSELNSMFNSDIKDSDSSGPSQPT